MDLDVGPESSFVEDLFLLQKEVFSLLLLPNLTDLVSLSKTVGPSNISASCELALHK